MLFSSFVCSVSDEKTPLDRRCPVHVSSYTLCDHFSFVPLNLFLLTHGIPVVYIFLLFSTWNAFKITDHFSFHTEKWEIMCKFYALGYSRRVQLTLYNFFLSWIALRDIKPQLKWRARTSFSIFFFYIRWEDFLK